MASIIQLLRYRAAGNEAYIEDGFSPDILFSTVGSGRRILSDGGEGFEASSQAFDIIIDNLVGALN